MKSNLCRVCGTLGGGGTTDCINKHNHERLLKTKANIRKMQQASYLFRIANNPKAIFKLVNNAGHSCIKEVLSKQVNNGLSERLRARKSLHFKRKKVCTESC